MKVIQNSSNSLLITPEYAAQVAGCSDRLIRKMCSDGRIKAVKLGSIWKINRSAFFEYMGIADDQAASRACGAYECN